MRSFAARSFVKVESYWCIEVRTAVHTRTYGIYPVDTLRLASQNWARSRGRCTRKLGVQMVTGSASHLCRLTAGRGGESVLLSAWLVGDWQGTPTNVAPDEHDEIRWFGPEELPPLAHGLLGTVLLDAIRIHRA